MLNQVANISKFSTDKCRLGIVVPIMWNTRVSEIRNKNRKYIVNKKLIFEQLLEVDHGCRSNDLQT